MEKLNFNTKNLGLTAKIVMLGFLTLLLLIPLELVKNVIRERSATRDVAIESIQKQWGGKQVVGGLVLNIPYTYFTLFNGEYVEREGLVHVLPEDLNYQVSISPEIRKRGIFESAVYVSSIQMQGHFKAVDTESFDANRISWEDAYVSLGVSENRGFKDEVRFVVNDSSLVPEPGVLNHDVFKSGIHAKVGEMSKTPLAFKLNFQLSGSSELALLPLGKSTQAKIESPWKDPNFIGEYLPSNREVTADGFVAHYTVTHLNRNYTQYFVGKEPKVLDSAFGVDLYMAVDHYQKSQRSAKYGILFIVLTFLIFVFAEITSKVKIHFFHYLLVSIALVMFFSLVTALSEKMTFSLAYIIGALATIGVIGFFTRFITKANTMVFRIVIVLLALYAFMFVLLQMNEYAFLAGNIGLFLILAAIMWFTGKISLFPSEVNVEEPLVKAN